MACMNDNSERHVPECVPEELAMILLDCLEFALFLEPDAVADLEFLAERDHLLISIPAIGEKDDVSMDSFDLCQDFLDLRIDVLINHLRDNGKGKRAKLGVQSNIDVVKRPC